MSVDVTFKINKLGEQLKKQLDELGQLEVAVGYPKECPASRVKYPDGTPVIEVVAYHELGTENSPSRPFLRNSLNGNKQELTDFMKSRVKDVIKGKKAKIALKEIGIFQKGVIQEEIRDGDFVPSEEDTTPLIDTGLMRSSVDFVVRKKGSSE